MDIGLEGYWRINKIKGYNCIFKIVVLGAESRFSVVSGVNPDPVEGVCDGLNCHINILRSG